MIVDLGTLGGGVHTSVIEFSGSVTGLEALTLAGADPGTLDYGGALGQAVCTLYGRGDAAVPDQCPGGWQYYRAVGGANGWVRSAGGASGTTVHDGDVEGWRYGGGAPPFQSFCSVAGCAAPAPPATVAPDVSAAGGGVASSGTDPGSTGPSSPPSTTAAPDPSSTTVPTTIAGARANGRDSVDDSGDGKPVALAAGVAGQAGSGGGGGSGGSPVGVVVALAVAGALVAAGLLVRRRRTAAG